MLANAQAAPPPAGWRMFVGGEWTNAEAGRAITSLDPATAKPLAEIPEASETDLNTAVSAARNAFDTGAWGDISAPERARMLLRIADLIDESAEEIARTETADNGMPLAFSRALVANGAETFRYFAGWVTKIRGATADFSSPAMEVHAYTRKEPAGVAGLIIPWNSPFSFACSKLAVCLAAGCTAVLKPAAETSLSAILLCALVEKAGLPAGVVNLVTGGAQVGAAMAAHGDIDKIAFTGSTETGRKIINAASGNLKKLTLELGGKSPVVILKDADLDKAIQGAALGIFRNSGQICMAGSRIYAHRTVFDQVASGISAFARALKIGPGTEDDVLMGPLISQRQRDRVLSYICDGQDKGGETLAGGNVWGDVGYFVEPTVIAGPAPDSAMMREEIFGPVAALQPFDDISEIPSLANDSPYGLSAAIWTRDIGAAHRLAKQIRAGTIWLNCQLVINQALPFGGYKQSGWGRENGLEGLEAYLETKTVIAAI